MLVPLTSSLYVPGELSNLDEVIVDIGTGYYVSKVSTKSLPHSVMSFCAQGLFQYLLCLI